MSLFLINFTISATSNKFIFSHKKIKEFKKEHRYINDKLFQDEDYVNNVNVDVRNIIEKSQPRFEQLNMSNDIMISTSEQKYKTFGTEQAPEKSKYTFIKPFYIDKNYEYKSISNNYNLPIDAEVKEDETKFIETSSSSLANKEIVFNSNQMDLDSYTYKKATVYGEPQLTENSNYNITNKVVEKSISTFPKIENKSYIKNEDNSHNVTNSNKSLTNNIKYFRNVDDGRLFNNENEINNISNKLADLIKNILLEVINSKNISNQNEIENIIDKKNPDVQEIIKSSILKLNKPLYENNRNIHLAKNTTSYSNKSLIFHKNKTEEIDKKEDFLLLKNITEENKVDSNKTEQIKLEGEISKRIFINRNKIKRNFSIINEKDIKIIKNKEDKFEKNISKENMIKKIETKENTTNINKIDKFKFEKIKSEKEKLILYSLQIKNNSNIKKEEVKINNHSKLHTSKLLKFKELNINSQNNSISSILINHLENNNIQNFNYTNNKNSLSPELKSKHLLSKNITAIKKKINIEINSTIFKNEGNNFKNDEIEETKKINNDSIIKKIKLLVNIKPVNNISEVKQEEIDLKLKEPLDNKNLIVEIEEKEENLLKLIEKKNPLKITNLKNEIKTKAISQKSTITHLDKLIEEIKENVKSKLPLTTESPQLKKKYLDNQDNKQLAGDVKLRHKNKKNDKSLDVDDSSVISELLKNFGHKKNYP